MFIETKVKYEKTLETGVQKKVSELYLVKAESFTEAEARIIEEMTPFIEGEFEVDAVKKNPVAEIFRGEGIFYCAKVGFITLDEKSGVEKTTTSTMLVQAEDFDGAVKNLKELMKGTMSDWKVVSISESNILDVYDKRGTSED